MVREIIKEKTFVLVIGIILGFIAAWFMFIEYPVIQQKQAEIATKKEYDKHVFEGRLVKVAPDNFYVDIKKGDSDDGIFRVSNYTIIQIAEYRANVFGKKPDLTKYFKKDDYVYMLVKDGKIENACREFRCGEKPAPGWVQIQKPKPGVQDIGTENE